MASQPTKELETFANPHPDRDYDITFEGLEEDYDPTIAQPSLLFIVKYSYDPTNGTISDGDIYRTKQ